MVCKPFSNQQAYLVAWGNDNGRVISVLKTNAGSKAFNFPSSTPMLSLSFFYFCSMPSSPLHKIPFSFQSPRTPRPPQLEVNLNPLNAYRSYLCDLLATF
jgi:hypothetical protein